MHEVTQILSAIDAGDPQAAAQLLPLVYDELRRLAAAQMAREKPGHTLDATGLVHEAWLRLVGARSACKGQDESLAGAAGSRQFDNRRHFFAAAAEAMRRILVENARRKKRLKHGGGKQRHELHDNDLVSLPDDDRLLALDEALTKLATAHPQLAELVQLRYFTGLTVEQAAEFLESSPRTVKRNWAYASAWLRREMGRNDSLHEKND